MKSSLLINMKMPTTMYIVGIFIFISRKNFMLSRAEQEKSFIISGPGVRGVCNPTNYCLTSMARTRDGSFTVDDSN